MAGVFGVLSSLEAVSGRIAKEDILKKNSTSQNLKEAFRLALDPSVNFYIKAIPEVKEAQAIETLTWALDALVEDLASRKYTGHAATKRLADILTVLTHGDQEVVRRVIGRNLKCGVSDATVEKIWPDLRLSYPCQLVSPMASGKIAFPCMAQTKMDGMRFNAHVKDGEVEYRSRNGKVMDLMGALDEDFLALGRNNIVYDGELLVYGHDGGLLDRKTGNGLLAKFQKGTGTEQMAKKIRAVLWDAIPMDAFWKGKCSVPCGTRLRGLQCSIDCARVKRLLNVTTHEVRSWEEARDLYQQKLDEGEEGIILKEEDRPWEDKRVKHQIKLKAELEADLLCTGTTPGTGKYHGMIGALEVASADGKVKCSVGTGLSDEERRSDPREFVGKVVAVKYNALITDKKTAAHSLFLPVFVEVRLDKDTADVI
jgi:ATP-dependent DNA ligase